MMDCVSVQPQTRSALTFAAWSVRLSIVSLALFLSAFFVPASVLESSSLVWLARLVVYGPALLAVVGLGCLCLAIARGRSRARRGGLRVAFLSVIVLSAGLWLTWTAKATTAGAALTLFASLVFIVALLTTAIAVSRDLRWRDHD